MISDHIPYHTWYEVPVRYTVPAVCVMPTKQCENGTEPCYCVPGSAQSGAVKYPSYNAPVVVVVVANAACVCLCLVGRRLAELISPYKKPRNRLLL